MYNGHPFSYGWLLACWPSRRVICIACRFHRIFSFLTAPFHCEVFYWLVQCDWALVVVACRVPMDISSCMPELFPSSTQYLIPWIDTHHLNQHPDWYLVDPLLTNIEENGQLFLKTKTIFKDMFRHLIDQQSVDSQLSFDLTIWIKWKLVECQQTVWQTVEQDVHGVSIKCQPRCWWRVSWVSMECWKGWSRVSMRVQINTQLLYLAVTIAWSTSKDH